MNPMTGSGDGSRRLGLGPLLANHDIVFAMGLAMILATLLIPLPTFLLDFMLSISIAIAVATMVIVLSTRGSIELPAFPSLLLLVTLFRLSLNVASTRLILLQGDAGDIIRWFGQTVVGNNLTVGLVVFLILVVIQFVVITKGSERISEVAARFNLDAMPGKQMAIDADLNAGLIGEEQARLRREKIVQESEFYGAMDGASKFVRGDAVASLIITAINLIGGFILGLSRGMTYAESIKQYSILAIGDGLISQVPALIISTSAGFLVSKTGTQRSVSDDLLRQALARPRPLGIAAFLLGIMVFIPGLPKIPFVALSIGCGLMARRLQRQEQQIAAEQAAPPAATVEVEQVAVEEVLDVDKICVLVGPRLVKSIDPRRKDSISHRITPLRRKFAQQFGIVLPLVRLRDNLTLESNTYEIRLFNHVVSTGRLEPDKYLAMDGGMVVSPVQGEPTNEPVFDLPALWIGADQKHQAELSGYTVVDPESVLVTHLSETLRRHAFELLSRDDVQKLIDRLREKQPSLVNSTIGELVPISLMHRVLQSLLRDGIPIRDLTQIVETLGDHAHRTKDPLVLTEVVRKALVRTITEKFADSAGRVAAITLDPSLEYELCHAGGESPDALNLPPERAVKLIRSVAEVWKQCMEQDREKVVLLCDYRIRRQMAGAMARQLPQLPVAAYDEIAIGTKIESVGAVSLPEDAMALAEASA